MKKKKLPQPRTEFFSKKPTNRRNYCRCSWSWAPGSGYEKTRTPFVKIFNKFVWKEHLKESLWIVPIHQKKIWVCLYLILQRTKLSQKIFFKFYFSNLFNILMHIILAPLSFGGKSDTLQRGYMIRTVDYNVANLNFKHFLLFIFIFFCCVRTKFKIGFQEFVRRNRDILVMSEVLTFLFWVNLIKHPQTIIQNLIWPLYFKIILIESLKYNYFINQIIPLI